MSALHLKDKSFRITDLARETTIVEGRTFNDCVIDGPAVLALINHVTIEASTFEAEGGDSDMIFWELHPNQRMVLGAIGIEHCVFRRCTFRRIGITGPPDLIADFKRRFESPDGNNDGD